MVDVLIVGAGVSGIGAAARLVREHPGTSFEIAEARERLGGTWDLHTYPGIRSDTDVASIAFPFEPWRKQTSIVSGAEIWDYLAGMVAHHHLAARIRFRTRIARADWDADSSRWQVQGTDADGVRLSWQARFLYLCTGFYDYENPHQPSWPGRDEFEAAGGRVVHPQLWPAGLSYTGQQVVVIGSGATAVTMAPALAAGPDAAAHVTMLQRTPSYVVSQPVIDPVANAMRRVLGPERGHRAARAKAKLIQTVAYEGARHAPRVARAALRFAAAASLRSMRLADEAFSPPYAPWAQRLTVAADGDLFAAMRRGAVTVVTDEIEGFEGVPARGIRCRSGRFLASDLVVSATGMTLLSFGGIAVSLGGAPVDPGTRASYLGVMLDGVPNFGYAMGSLSAAWTLRADEATQAFLRLMDAVAERDARVATPTYTGEPVSASSTPAVQLGSGYVRRGDALLPRQGDHWPWTVDAGMAGDVRALRRAMMTDDMTFSSGERPGE